MATEDVSEGEPTSNLPSSSAVPPLTEVYDRNNTLRRKVDQWLLDSAKDHEHGSSDVKEAKPVNPSCDKPLSVVSDMSSLTSRSSSRGSRSSSKRSNATVKAAMARLHLQQAEEAFRLEKGLAVDWTRFEHKQ